MRCDETYFFVSPTACTAYIMCLRLCCAAAELKVGRKIRSWRGVVLIQKAEKDLGGGLIGHSLVEAYQHGVH